MTDNVLIKETLITASSLKELPLQVSASAALLLPALEQPQHAKTELASPAKWMTIARVP
jgi:hypothetical protein